MDARKPREKAAEKIRSPFGALEIDGRGFHPKEIICDSLCFKKASKRLRAS
jgi:hypothetical protein